VAEELVTLVSQGNLDALDLFPSQRLQFTAQDMNRSNLDWLIRSNGHAANFVGTLKGWGCALTSGEPERRTQNE
jgi:hypothetical protein